MITRITMDIDVDWKGKTYLTGEVYDCRFCGDEKVAIDSDTILTFLVREWAHEQTWDEWFAKIDSRRNDDTPDDHIRNMQDHIIKSFFPRVSTNPETYKATGVEL